MDEVIINKTSPLSRQIPKRIVEVEMFKAGEQMDSDGDRAKFTEQDLDDIVSGYNPSNHEAPLIIGHDQDDSTPSLGWVRSIWRKGKSLWGKIELTPKAEKIISDGTFKKVSSSFYAPGADTNPNKGKLSLRHLALVSIPAVKGLAEFKEITTDVITMDFSEQRSKSMFKDLLDTNKKIMPRTRKKTISDHAEGTVNLTINVGSDAAGGDKKVPLYDDSGAEVTETGLPADYEMEFGDEEDPDEAIPPDETLEEDLDPETEEEPEESDPEMEEDPEADPEEVEDSVEDISEDLDTGDEEEVIQQLVSEYTAVELFKALALKKQTSDMMEESVSSQDYSEACEDSANDNSDITDDKKKKEKDFACKDDDDEEETEEYSEEEKECCDEDKEETGEYSEEEKDFACKDEEETEEYGEEEKEDASEMDKLKARLADLEEELQKQRKNAREKEISDYCESIYNSGKLIESVVSKKELVKFMSTLNSKNTVNFSENNRQSQFDFFSSVLEKLPQVVSFSEVATEASAPVKPLVKDKDELSGFAYDKKSLELHAKALDFSEKNNVDYVTALKSII